MPTVWDKLSNLGISRDMDARLAKNIKLANRLATIQSSMVLPYSLIFLFLGFAEQALVLALVFIPLVFVLVLNKNKKYLLAKLLVVPVTNITIFYFALCMGKDVGTHLTLFYAAILPWFFFNAGERGYAIGSSLLSIALFYYLVLVPFMPALKLDPQLVQLSYIMGTSTTFLLLVVTVALFYHDNNRTELFLGNTNKILQETKTKLQQTLTENDAVITFTQSLYSHSNSIDELCVAALRKMQDMMHCTYGAVLLYNKENDELRLQAEIGFSRDAKRPQTIRNGETLTGDAFKRQKTIRIQDTPQSYWHTSSGMGNVKPAELIIIPLSFKMQTGVMELAFMQPPNETDMAILQRAGVALAANLLVLVSNAENAELVSILQQQRDEITQNYNELEQLREKTGERNREQYEAQQTLIKQIVDKGKLKEQELMAQIAELQNKLKAS